MKTKSLGRRASLIIGLLLTITCIGLLVTKAIPAYQLGRESDSWPKTTGTIVGSKIESHLSIRNKIHKKSSKAVISYAYNLDGKMYVSQRIYPYEFDVLTNNAQDTVKLYRVGNTVEVFYSPENFSSSVLVPGVTFYHYLLLILLTFFGFVGLKLLYSFFSKKQ
jgi:hypothetical protein